MFWLVVTILLGLVFVGALFAVWIAQSNEGRRAAFMTMVAAPVVWVVFSFFFCIHTVGQRQVGVVYNFSGTISGKKNAGVVMTWPWQHVKKENVGLQKEEFDLGADNAAVSQDQQAIYARLTVNYQVEASKVVDLF